MSELLRELYAVVAARAAWIGSGDDTAWNEYSLLSVNLVSACHAEIAEALADARRYRWLREQHWESAGIFVVAGSKAVVKLGTYCPSQERLDDAIDASIAIDAHNSAREAGG